MNPTTRQLLDRINATLPHDPDTTSPSPTQTIPPAYSDSRPVSPTTSVFPPTVRTSRKWTEEDYRRRGLKPRRADRTRLAVEILAESKARLLVVAAERGVTLATLIDDVAASL